MILDEIVQHKRLEVDEARKRVPLSEISSRGDGGGPVRPFTPTLRRPGRIRIIAELKKASPSAGLLRPDFVPENIAETYEANGAAALSVLTDQKYFQGELDYVTRARDSTSLPVLRKDFTIDPYQVHEAREAGADCILLIVRILRVEEIKDFLTLARELAMEALVETHSEVEIDTALECGATLIGINNRNLDTLKVDIETTGHLRERIPSGLTVISESGIKTADDIRRLRDWGVDGALIGESLMRSSEPGALLSDLANA